MKTRDEATILLENLGGFREVVHAVLAAEDWRGKWQAAARTSLRDTFRSRRQTRPCHPRRTCFYPGVIFPLNSRLTLPSGN
ncbi:MAG: hypothetical protein ABI464_09865 [Chthoniobacteraceae bacterium]